MRSARVYSGTVFLVIGLLVPGQFIRPCDSIVEFPRIANSHARRRQNTPLLAALPLAEQRKPEWVHHSAQRLRNSDHSPTPADEYSSQTPWNRGQTKPLKTPLIKPSSRAPRTRRGCRADSLGHTTKVVWREKVALFFHFVRFSLAIRPDSSLFPHFPASGSISQSPVSIPITIRSLHGFSRCSLKRMHSRQSVRAITSSHVRNTYYYRPH